MGERFMTLLVAVGVNEEGALVGWAGSVWVV